MQIKGLEKSFVKAVKDIKADINKLEQNKKIPEIIIAQTNLEEIISANSDAIKRIDSEILRIKIDEAKADSEKQEDEIGETDVNTSTEATVNIC